MAEHDDSFADSLRRAAGAAYDATVGRVTDAVGDVALDATEGTARAVVADLQPYLIADVIPDIIEGITPHLTETVVPQVVDAITPHLVEVTVPAVVQGATPELVDSLLPELLDRLRPYLESQLVPQVVDALVPHINEVVAPQIVDALTPLISSEVAPQVIDGVMPHVIEDSAPRIISGVLPMIRNEVVPQIMDDIVDDPRVRSLIKEQSQALVLDSLERVRRGLARADDIVDNIVRWVARRPPRPSQTNAQARPSGFCHSRCRADVGPHLDQFRGGFGGHHACDVTRQGAFPHAFMGHGGYRSSGVQCGSHIPCPVLDMVRSYDRRRHFRRPNRTRGHHQSA